MAEGMDLGPRHHRRSTDALAGAQQPTPELPSRRSFGEVIGRLLRSLGRLAAEASAATGRLQYATNGVIIPDLHAGSFEPPRVDQSSAGAVDEYATGSAPAEDTLDGVSNVAELFALMGDTPAPQEPERYPYS